MYTLLPTVTQSQLVSQTRSSEPCSTGSSKPRRSTDVIASFSIEPSLQQILDSCSHTGNRIIRSLRKPPSLPIQPHVLHPNQLQDVQWLHTLHKTDINGILADEMGLGKTVQTLVFLSLLPQPPALIIAPTGLLHQWQMEIGKWCRHFQVMVYSGCQQERRDLRRQFRKDLPIRYHFSDDALHRIAEALSPRLVHASGVTPKSVEDHLKAMSDLEIHLLLQHYVDVLPSLGASLVGENVISNRSFQQTNYSLLRTSRS